MVRPGDRHLHPTRSPQSALTPGGAVAEPQPRQVWFLTGSQHLYGPETLAQVAEQSETVSRRLAAGDRLPAEILWKPVLTDSAAIRACLAAADQDPACIGV